MSVYSRRPWLTLYDRDVPADIESRAASALELFQASLARAPGRPLIHYFDSTLTLDEVAILSDGLAAAFGELGIERGERVAVYLQNVPQFAVAMLATSKVGGIVIPVNPMLKEREPRSFSATRRQRRWSASNPCMTTWWRRCCPAPAFASPSRRPSSICSATRCPRCWRISGISDRWTRMTSWI